MTELRSKIKRGRSGAYLGYSALATILSVLREEKTPQAASDITNVGLPRMRLLLKQFLDLGVVDRVGWEFPTHGYAAPVYRMGSGLQVPAPKMPNGMPQTLADFRPRLQPRIVAFCSLVQALRHGGSLTEIAHQSGVAAGRLSDVVKHMHALRLVHISGWDRSPVGPVWRLWAWGSGVDVRRPKCRPRVRNRAAAVLGRTSWAETVVSLKRGAGIKRPSARLPAALRLSEGLGGLVNEG